MDQFLRHIYLDGKPEQLNRVLDIKLLTLF